MILAQHRRHRIPLGRKFKQQEIIIPFGYFSGVCDIDIRVFINIRIQLQFKIFEGKCLRIIELFLCAGLYRITVEHDITNIYLHRSQSNIESIGSRTHRKHKPSGRHIIADRPDNRFLQFGNF